MAKKNFYAVVNQGKFKICTSWTQANKHIQGVSGVLHKGFRTHGEAVEWAQEKRSAFIAEHRITIQNSSGRIYIPPHDKRGRPMKKNTYGFYKCHYFMKDGVQHAHFGRTIGAGFTNRYNENDTSIPFEV